MSVHAVPIINARDGEVVDAELDDDLSIEALLDIEAEWAADRETLREAIRKAGIPKAEWPGGLHWDWGEKSWRLSLSARRAKYRIFGLSVAGTWQGVMLTLKDTYVAHLAPDAGKPLVYLDFIEVAPGNRTVREVGWRRKYGNIGVTLFAAAVAQSCALGCDGRLGLHALEQAETFYLGREMAAVPRQEKEGMKYFELTAAAAAKRHGRR